MHNATDLDGLISAHRAGFSLERPFYTDPGLFQADLEAIFLRSWLYAGHGARIPNRGDYFTLQVGSEPLIAIRGEDGRVRVLLNVCRHRGSRLCSDGAGSAKRLVCPYHQWVYATDGSLQRARLMPAGFDLSGYALQQLQVRELDGLIFFSFAEDPPDFDEFAARMAPRLAHHALPDAKLAAVRTYSIRANWKLVVENSRECYHCGTGHPQYCRAVGFAAAVDSREAIAETRRVREDILPELVRRGVETEEIPFTADTWYHALHFLLRPGMLTESMDGRPVAPLMGSFCDWSAGCMAIVAMPSFMLEASCDHVFTLRFLPDGPDATSAEACWFVAPNAREGADYEIAKLTEFWHLTCVQDWKLCEENQAGVNSLHYRPGPYAPDESGAAAFAEWYLRRLAPASAARESTL